MPEEGKNILKYNQRKKSLKSLFIMYLNTELLLENNCAYDNSAEQSSTAKLSKHTVCGYSFFAHFLFDSSKSKRNFYRGVDWMKKFCADLKKHAADVIDFEKKEILPLTDKEIESYNHQKFHHICKAKFLDVDDSDDDNDDDSKDDSDGEGFNTRDFHGDAAGLDDVDDGYYDNDDDELVPESFMTMLSNLILIMITTIMMRNSMVWDFKVLIKVMKESVITSIIQANTGWLHNVSVI